MDEPADRADLRTLAEPPRFVVGSTMRHVLVMTGTGAVGLIAIFVVDLVSLLYISWLDDPSLTAGVGLATVVMFFTVSINVGLMIPIGALVSRALGARDPDRARRTGHVGLHPTWPWSRALVSLLVLAAPAVVHAAIAAGRRGGPAVADALPLDRAADQRASWRSAWLCRASCARRATPGAACT